MSDDQQQVHQAPGVPLVPLPTAVSWQLVEATQDDGRGGNKTETFMALSFATPSGSQTYFLPFENARRMNDGVSALLREMPSGPSGRQKIITPQVDARAVMAALEKQKNGGKR